MTTMDESLLREAAAVTLGGEPMVPDYDGDDDFYSFNSTVADTTTSTQPPTATPTDYFYNYTFDTDAFYSTNSIRDDFTAKQEFILNWTGRVAAFISFLGGLYICYWTWKRRDHVYHRLMFAMSIYILLWSPWMMYGIAALPVGTPDVFGAYGTIATCTAQGIFNQLSTAIPAYYVALSGFSWVVVVYGHFDAALYGWAEKHIHFWVNLWAISSSSWLASIEAFNPSEGFPGCWIGAVPMGCGEESGVPCDRGPNNISDVLALMTGLPVVVLMVVPTVIMIALACFLYFRERKEAREEEEEMETEVEDGAGADDDNDDDDDDSDLLPQGEITVGEVTKQSIVYLGALYWIYVPGLMMSWYGQFFGDEKKFGLSVFGTAIVMSKGLWYALVYHYFSSPGVEEEGSGILTVAARRVSKVLEPMITVRGSCSERFRLGDSGSGAFRTGSGPFRKTDSMDGSNKKSTSFKGFKVPHLSKELSTSVSTQQTCSKDDTVREDSAKETVREDSTKDSEIPLKKSSPSSSSSSSPSKRRNSRKSIRKNNSGRSLGGSSGKSVRSGTGKSRGDDASRKSLTFNIFDGTAPSNSQWAQFIYDGDESDEEHELEETNYWAGCQDVA